MHLIDDLLPEIRPRVLPNSCLLGSDQITLMFHAMEIPEGCKICMQLVPITGEHDLFRQEFADWRGLQTVVSMSCPHPKEKKTFTVRLLISLGGVNILCSRHWAYDIEVHPNTELQKQPVIHDVNPHTGGGGTKVWIQGSNFSECVQVLFGSKSSIIYSATSTLIKCLTPDDSSGQCSLYVVNGKSIYCTSPEKFTCV